MRQTRSRLDAELNHFTGSFTLFLLQPPLEEVEDVP